MRLSAPLQMERSAEGEREAGKAVKTPEKYAEPIPAAENEVDVMEDLQEVKSQQASLFALEASKINFQSRVCFVERDKTRLCFFFQKVHRESSVLSSLKEENGSDGVVDTCLISWDQKKAFDRVSHMYMRDMLSKMGFGESICNWTQLLYTNIVNAVSINGLVSICNQFELASGAEVNRGESEPMLFGNWADQFFTPFTIRTNYLKVPGLWFRGVEACAKTWEERVIKLRQKLSRWAHWSLSIAGKNLVI
eukprot:g46342.t1